MLILFFSKKQISVELKQVYSTTICNLSPRRTKTLVERTVDRTLAFTSVTHRIRVRKVGQTSAFEEKNFRVRYLNV